MITKFKFQGNAEMAKLFAREGLRQASILENAVKFQSLKQNKRLVRYSNGIVINCVALFNIQIISIYVPLAAGIEKPLKIVEAIFCWCSLCFSDGIILEALGTQNSVGSYAEDYPEVCKNPDSNISKFNGIRYKVAVCQKTSRVPLICTASDFSNYAVNDIVIVAFLGNWENQIRIDPDCWQCSSTCVNSQDTTCQPCEALVRDGEADEVDGTFVIVPVDIEGITNIGNS